MMADRLRWIALAALAVVLAVVPTLSANEYELRLFILFMIYAIIAVGLNVLVGLAGLVSLGQAGLFALGAYAAAILSTTAGLGVIPSSLAAVAIASVFGVVLAYPTVRVRGVYLAVITIAFGLIVENVAIEWTSLTGGTTGISGIPKPAIGGWELRGLSFYALVAVQLLATVLLIDNIRRSRFGRAMRAVSFSETAAKSLGINVTATRTLAFVISAATAGLAGVLYAYLNSYISPDIFGFGDSVRFLLMVIFGGAGSAAGPIVGAYVLTYLPEYLQQFQLWQKFAYGALLAFVIFVLPQGVVGTAASAVRRLWPRPRELSAEDLADATPATQSEPAAGSRLQASDVTVRFGGLVALSGASLTVEPGQIHALIGPNGAGKSTFINAISGFYQPAGGAVTIDGVDIVARAPHMVARAGISRTFQNTELFADLTVMENVMVGYDGRFSYRLWDAALRTPRFAREETACRRVASGLLQFVGLTDYAHEQARSLPFGLQRRLEIARALASAPRLLLLDEPAAGLTHAEIEDLDVTIRKISDLGISILLIEHHVDLIMAVAEMVTVLDYGEVIASAPPSAVQNDPKVIEAYFGSAAQNLGTRA